MKAAAFAAQHRQLVDQLIFWMPVNGPDFHQEQLGTVVSLASKDWKIFTEAWAQMSMGWSGGQRAGEYASFIRESMTQELFVRFLEVIGEWDITPYLSEIEAQTLVLSGRASSPETLQLVASGVRNAQLVRLPDSPVVYWEDEYALEAIEEFLGLTLIPPITILNVRFSPREVQGPKRHPAASRDFLLTKGPSLQRGPSPTAPPGVPPPRPGAQSRRRAAGAGGPCCSTASLLILNLSPSEVHPGIYPTLIN